MVRVIQEPKRINAEGSPPKMIEEFIGRVNSGTSTVSVARMVSPKGWSEPGQTPEFDEFSIVLRGALHVETRDGSFRVGAGQAVVANKGEWVALQHAGGRRSGVHRRLRAGVLSTNGSPRCVIAPALADYATLRWPVAPAVRKRTAAEQRSAAVSGFVWSQSCRALRGVIPCRPGVPSFR